ncbi:MAG: hypothetical protein MUF82_04250 [Bacteroidetes bacterium]|nr:hypothetical protein [Bacteroidota bacterium]
MRFHLMGFLVAVLLVMLAIPLQAQFATRSMDIGIGAGYNFGGEIDVGGFDVDKEGNFLIEAFGDFYLMEKFAWGLYAKIAPGVTTELSDEDATMYEFGMALKPRFILGNGDIAIKPGLEIGYRILDIDVDVEGVDVNGMALNGSVELQFKTQGNLVPYAKVGFIAQPSGGNDFDDVTWAPIFYVTGGVSF